MSGQDIRKWFSKGKPKAAEATAKTEEPEPSKPSPAKQPSKQSVKPGSGFKEQKPVLQRSSCGDAVKKESAEHKRRPSASQKDDSEPAMRSKRRRASKYDFEEDEDEDEADLDFLADEDEEEEAPKKAKPARGRASGATPKKSEATAAEAKPSAGRGGGGAGRSGGGGGGGGGGRGLGRAAFFMEPKAAPPHKGEKEVPEGPEDALAGLTFVITGTLDSIEREEAEDLIKRHGGRVTGSVSKKTVSGTCMARSTAPTPKTSIFDWPLPSMHEYDATASPLLSSPSALESGTGGMADELGSLFQSERYLETDHEAWALSSTRPSGISASSSTPLGGGGCCNGGRAGDDVWEFSPRVAASDPFPDEFPVGTAVRGREPSPTGVRSKYWTRVPGSRQEHGRQFSSGNEPLNSTSLTCWEEPFGDTGKQAGWGSSTRSPDIADEFIAEGPFRNWDRSGTVDELLRCSPGPGIAQETSDLQRFLESPLHGSAQLEGWGLQSFHMEGDMTLLSKKSSAPFALPYTPEPASVGGQVGSSPYPSDASGWDWPPRAGESCESKSRQLSDSFVGFESLRHHQPLTNRTHILPPAAPASSWDCTHFLPLSALQSSCSTQLPGRAATPPRDPGRTTTFDLGDNETPRTACWTGNPPSCSTDTYLLTEEEGSETSKARKARELGVKQLKEDGLFDLIRQSAAKASSEKKPIPPPSPLKDRPSPAAGPSPLSSVARGVPRSSSAAPPPEAPKPQRLADSNGNRETAAAAPGPLDTEAWPQKWAPKTLADVVGNPGLVKQLRDWLQNWHDVHGGGPKKGGPKKGGRMGGGVEGLDKKAVLLSGPPGIGKTTCARLVAAGLGFTPMEVNASDSRGKSDSKVRNGMGGSTANAIKEMVSNTSIFFKSSGSRSSGGGSGIQERAVLIMDEVDGMSGGDRGGVADLILSIKSSRVPIICICNDRYSQKLKSLVNHCFALNYRKPTKQQMAKRLTFIAKKEGIDIPESALEELGERVNGDMRMALNQLQYMSLRSKSLSYMDVKTRLERSAKDEDIRPMAACDTLLGFGASRLSFDRLMDAAMSDMDLMPLMIQENYLNHVPASAGADPSGEQLMHRVAAAADAITAGDLVNKQIRRYQQWQHLQFSGFMSCITPSLLMHGRRVTLEQGERNFERFPSWLGKNSTAGKNVRLLDELRGHMVSAKAAASPSWQAVRMDYVECLERSIILPLKSQDPEAGVQRAADLMEDYALTPEDLETATVVSKFKGRPEPAAGIPPAVKGKLTRELRKRMQDSKARSSAMLPPVALHGGRGKALAASFRPKKGARKARGATSEAWLDTSAVQADPDMPMPVEEGATLQADNEDGEEDVGDDLEEDNDEESTRQRLLGAPVATQGPKETKRKGKQDGAAPRGRGKKAKT